MCRSVFIGRLILRSRALIHFGLGVALHSSASAAPLASRAITANNVRFIVLLHKRLPSGP